MNSSKAHAFTQDLSPKQWLAIAGLTLLTCAAGWLAWQWWLRVRPIRLLVNAVTVAGAGPQLTANALADPFGVAVGDDDEVYVTDGLGGRIYRVGSDGRLALVTEKLDMPSALAVAPDGSLIVANTGAQTIVRVNVADGSVTTIAGQPNVSGRGEGPANAARLNGPIGVAVAPAGMIFVADTYNDRICVIDAAGQMRTLAGGNEPGYRDGAGLGALFDTPCGLVVARDGALIVADTGNHRIRRVTLDGTVTTLAGTGEWDMRDGAPLNAGFAEPVALAWRRDGALAIADAASSTLRLLTFGEQPAVSTIAGGYPVGLVDGALREARLNRPLGLAFTRADVPFVADNGNGFLRAFIPAGVTLGRTAKPEEALVKAAEVRRRVPARWPYQPPEARREIAGTFGEIRGERSAEGDAWFHNGLDIPGAYGETVYALHGERVTRPLAVEGFNTTRERLRLPLLGYIHLRLGRDQNDAPFFDIENQGFLFRRDVQGQLTGLRIRRGTRINEGAALGTLNRLNHVHLIAGPASSEVNALAALQLPGLSDTVAPTIERVSLLTETGARLDWPAPATAAAKRKASPPPAEPLTVQGRVRILVQAYDQADGNARQRRLGLYRLGYQVFNADGTAARGFAQPHYNLIFERLPDAANGVALAYAEGSQSGYTGQTIFVYIVTNVVRDGLARAEFWETGQLAAGTYMVRVFAEDYFGNQARRDMTVRVLSGN
ncbi:MAG: SMP-30/gluconolactonase/LRE family protein [Acidobacteria bacterium]|nr:SMP-30/gluconolactonase/LRE family protein [Acidobacteriota bacterium]MBI3427371.1 SMP-30/gluconolactonase/LRE family protein [Acidobacteriota bacterium]